MNSGDRARRFVTLLAAFSFLSVTLVACQVAGNSGGAANNNNNGLSFTTPNAKQSPIATFPPFTIGAWPSNYSPNANDNITIYVLCRVQDQSMQNPASAPSPTKVTVQIEAPINKTYNGTTDASGLAAVPITFIDPTPGQPVTVTVYATWNNKPYSNTTFFTPGATYTPTPAATATGGPGGKGTPTATTHP